MNQFGTQFRALGCKKEGTNTDKDTQRRVVCFPCVGDPFNHGVFPIRRAEKHGRFRSRDQQAQPGPKLRTVAIQWATVSTDLLSKERDFWTLAPIPTLAERTCLNQVDLESDVATQPMSSPFRPNGFGGRRFGMTSLRLRRRRAGSPSWAPPRAWSCGRSPGAACSADVTRSAETGEHCRVRWAVREEDHRSAKGGR